jgi:hypothetical protein
MADTGLIYATSAANNAAIGTRAWSNVSNIVGNNTNNAVYADCAAAAGNLVSNYLVGTFSHGLSGSDTITGIVAAYRRWGATNNANIENSFKLVKNGTISGTEKTNFQAFPSTPGYGSDHGGSTDLWGLTLTGADTIGLAVSVNFNEKNETIRIYAMRLTIYYTPGGDANLGGFLKRRVVIIGA